jgi:hypothetical protein
MLDPLKLHGRIVLVFCSIMVQLLEVFLWGLQSQQHRVKQPDCQRVRTLSFWDSITTASVTCIFLFSVMMSLRYQ